MSTYHRLYHGGPGIWNPQWHLYPEGVLTPGDPLAPAAHKEAVTFGLTRLLDFSQKDGRRQAGLQQYMETMTTLGTPMQQGDIIGLCIVPAKSFFWGFSWEVEKPENGVTLNAKVHSTGQSLATINASTVDSGGQAMSVPPWLKDNDIIDIELTAWPTSVPTELRVSFTPVVIWPKMGN